jgi:hypothetical protein
MSRAKMNYAVDAVIAVAFVISAVTGLAFLLMGSGGYQGGRNPAFRPELLGLARGTWSDLHTWGSLMMIAAVGLHLVLHWRWIWCVTKDVLRPAWRRNEDVCEVPVQGISREGGLLMGSDAGK